MGTQWRHERKRLTLGRTDFRGGKRINVWTDHRASSESIGVPVGEEAEDFKMGYWVEACHATYLYNRVQTADACGQTPPNAKILDVYTRSIPS